VVYDSHPIRVAPGASPLHELGQLTAEHPGGLARDFRRVVSDARDDVTIDLGMTIAGFEKMSTASFTRGGREPERNLARRSRLNLADTLSCIPVITSRCNIGP